MNEKSKRHRFRRLISTCALLTASALANAEDRQPTGWKLVTTEGQTMPVPKVWLEGEEARIAHSLKLPDVVPKPQPYDFKQPLWERFWFGSHRKASVRYFDHLCATEAGQWIVRTVANVDGFYFARPQGNKPPRPLMTERWGPENPWVEMSDALTQGDRFEIALSDGQARPLAELVRGLGSMGVEDGWDNGYLIGGDGDDLLRGQGGQDTLSGQGGSDALLGGEGDDLYLIDFDPGHDQIIDLQGRNTVRFGPGVPADAVRIERVGDGTDLRLSLDDECSVTVRRALEGAVVRYEFDDGSAWTLDNLIGRLGLSHGLSLVGTSGSDELVGTVLGDFISAGPGDDSLP